MNKSNSLVVVNAVVVCTVFLTSGVLFAADTTVKGTTADNTASSLEVTNSADASLMLVRNDGNVGIGDTSPAARLTVGSGDLFQVSSGGNVTLNSANTTQTTTSSVVSLNGNSLTSGTGLYAASSSLTSGKLVDLQVSGTAAAASQTALNIATAGANGTNAITTYGAQISNTHTNATSGTNIGLSVTASGATTANYPIVIGSGGAVTTTTAAGAVEYDGKVIYTTPEASSRGVAPSEMLRVLTADTAGQNVSTAQPWFPSTGSVTLPGSTGYFFRGGFSSVRSAGTTSHTTNILFGGTATLTDISYFVEVKEGDAATIADSDLIAIQVATSTNIKAASTSATENIVFTVEGTVWVNGGGTFIPQFIYSAAPGGAPTIEKGTYFALYPIGSNTASTVGNWS